MNVSKPVSKPLSKPALAISVRADENDTRIRRGDVDSVHTDGIDIAPTIRIPRLTVRPHHLPGHPTCMPARGDLPQC